MEQGMLTPRNAERLIQGRLTPEVRRFIKLRFGDYRSDQEIAARLGKTCQDVRREFHRLAEIAAAV